MIQQKARFVKGPYNFAIEKSNLLKLKVHLSFCLLPFRPLLNLLILQLEAEQNGNLEELEHIQHQIDELEAKAAELVSIILVERLVSCLLFFHFIDQVFFFF